MAHNKNDRKEAYSFLTSQGFEKKSDGSMSNGKIDAKVFPSIKISFQSLKTPHGLAMKGWRIVSGLK